MFFFCFFLAGEGSEKKLSNRFACPLNYNVVIGHIVFTKYGFIRLFVQFIRLGEMHNYGQPRSKLIGKRLVKPRRITQPSAKIIFKSRFSMINI